MLFWTVTPLVSKGTHLRKNHHLSSAKGKGKGGRRVMPPRLLHHNLSRLSYRLLIKQLSSAMKVLMRFHILLTQVGDRHNDKAKVQVRLVIQTYQN